METTALVKVNPDADIEVMAFYNEAVRLKEFAEDRVIANLEDMTLATDDLAIIAKVKKGMEEKRKDYLKPFQDHVKETNEAYKSLMEPIEMADRINKDKILAYRQEQERIRLEQEEINRMRLEAAQKEMELTGELSESVGLVEVAPEAPKRVSTDMGTAGQRDNWKWEVVDFSIVPDEYKMINPAVLTPAAKSYKDTRTIPGVRIYNEPIIAIHTRR